MLKRALLVGAGGMGQAWAKNLDQNPDAEIAGWIDVRPGAAEAAAEKHGLSVAYFGTDVQVALSAVSPDFVVDVTPPEIHHSVTLAALAAGVPVLGEKPMASTMAEAREMVAASEAAGKLYMVSQSRRYNAQLTALRSLFDSHVGRPEILFADFMIGAHFGGFRDEMAHVLLLDMAIHTFDEARFLTGANPISVYAEEYNPSWSWYQGAACANACFEMSDGLRFNYRGSWCAEGLPTSWDGDWRGVGPRGTAMWLNNQTPFAEHVVGTGGFHSEMARVEAEVPPMSEGISGSLQEFLRALEGDFVPNGECHDNIQSLAMVFAAIESAKRGERVLLAEIL